MQPDQTQLITAEAREGMHESRWQRLKADLLDAREVVRGNKLWDPFRRVYVDVRTSPGDTDLETPGGRLAYAKALFENGLLDADDYEFVKRRIASDI